MKKGFVEGIISRLEMLVYQDLATVALRWLSTIWADPLGGLESARRNGSLPPKLASVFLPAIHKADYQATSRVKFSILVPLTCRFHLPTELLGSHGRLHLC